MGVDRAQLYGTAPGASYRYRIPRGEPPEALAPLPFTARSLFLENPSGVWYSVAGFTVAPWTWAQITRLDVPTTTIQVALVTQPELLISEDYGEDLTVIAYEDALVPSQGRQLYPPPHDVLHVEVDVDVPPFPGIYIDVISALAGRRIVPLRVGLYGRIAPPLRGLAEGAWLYDDAGVGRRIEHQSLSPETPLAVSVITDRPLPEAIALSLVVWGEDGTGIQGVVATVDYFVGLP